ncbi:MAG: (Fe-S)-binding protein [Anaerolineales bacterium]|nr:(Fe-S)-binding protein [Anaerolineales bacterium]
MEASPVQLFITCLANTFTPEVGFAVIEVLGRAGYKTEFPAGQTCCGQPAYNAGLWSEARQMARYTIETLEGAEGPVVLPSGSCTAMLRHGYHELFKDDPAWLKRAEALAERTYEFSEFLVDVAGKTELGSQYPQKTAYHPSCHLMRDLGVDRQPRQLLEQVDGLDLVPLEEEDTCCGFGGLFSAEHPEISSEMLKRKLRTFEESGASTLVTCDTGCLLHILGGLKEASKPGEVRHLAEVLAADS